jgi:hypothetical protein
MIFTVKGYNIQIDNEDAERIMAYSWWVSSAPEIDGHVLCFSTKVGRKIIKLHRFIMGDPVGYIVDHRDGNRLDNRKQNLRICRLGDNNRNLGIICRNTSGYKGVSFCKKCGKYRAYIHLASGHQKHLGFFDTAEEAALVYEQKARELFGEYYRETKGA